MKLLTKYNRIYLVAIILIFLLASVAYYFSLNYIVTRQADEDLRIEQREIQTYVHEHGRLPEVIAVRDQLIHYEALPHAMEIKNYESKVLYDTLEQEHELFRQLTFSVQAGGTWYEVMVAKSMEASAHLVHSILLITFSTIILILTASFIINRLVLKRLWRPFYHTLYTIKNFKLGKDGALSFTPTSTEEFSFMNGILHSATHQAQIDYGVLKEFTENAAHELQTPLAVIRSKLDLLIQEEGLNAKQSHAVQMTYKAIEKLSRLNHSLLLLAKIENRQYDEVQLIDLGRKLHEKTNEFQELWEGLQLTVQVNLQPVQCNMNEELADILLNNLLSNATRHNCSGGFIGVTLTSGQLCIQNSSQQKALDTSRMFNRFYKPAPNNEYNGLGLSIIKQICDVSGIAVQYSYQEGLHQFKLEWS